MRLAPAAMSIIAFVATGCSPSGGITQPPRPETEVPRAPDDHAAPDAKNANAEGGDPTLASDVATLARQRLDALEALAPERIRGELLDAIGPCVRPSATDLAALLPRVRAFVGKATRHPAPTQESPLVVKAGCVEPGGTTLFVQWDWLAPDTPSNEGPPNEGHWWLLSVGPRAIRVMDAVHGMAESDWMEWANEQSLAVLALIDLDRDGRLDAVTAHVAHEGGAMDAHFTLRTVSAAGPKEVGRYHGWVRLARYQPVPGVAVLDARSEMDEGKRQHRCVDDSATWHRCPASDASLRFDRALEVGPRLMNALPGKDELDLGLALLGVDAAEREPLVKRAAPSSAGELVGRFGRQRLETWNERLPEEREAILGARIDALAESIRAAIGDTACPSPEPRARRALEAAVTRWVASLEKTYLEGRLPCDDAGTCRRPRAPEPMLSKVCAGARGTLVFAAWRDVFVEDVGETSGLARGALLFMATGRGASARPRISLVLEAEHELRSDMYGLEGPEAAGLTVRMSLHGGEVRALVASDSELVAIVDDHITGRDNRLARLSWVAADATEVFTLDEAPLALVDKDGVSLWLRADATGLVPVSSFPVPTLLTALDGDALTRILLASELRVLAHERVASAASDFDLAVGPDMIRALSLLDADPTLVARVRAALP